MTPEVKERIEQIRNGIVPEGYRKTKIGIMPEEWEEKRIGDVLMQRKTLMCISKETPLLSFTIAEGIIEPEDKKSNKRDFLIKDIATKKFALTEVGDIIYNPANLKFGAIHRNNLRRGLVSPIYGIFYGAHNSSFMGHLLRTQRFIDYTKIYTEGTVEKLKTLSADSFLKLIIVLPSDKEQEKITKILDVQDKLIELEQQKLQELKKAKKYFLEKMFSKKEQLLPAIRLPGFEGEWERKTVLDLLVQPITDGPHETPKLVAEGIPFISVDAIVDNKIDFRRKRGNISEAYHFECCKKYEPKYLDVFLVKSGSTVGKVALVETSERFNIWSPLAAMRCGDKTDPYLLYYLLQTPDMQEQVVDKASSGTQPNLSMRELEKFSVIVPSCIREQKAIGTYFRQLDNLIVLQERKVHEEKQRKKALMQLLLTGIVRVNA